MKSATPVRDALQRGVPNVSAAVRGPGARREDVLDVAAGTAGRHASRALDPRILLVLLCVLAVVSVLLFWPVLQLFYWPTANGVDVIGYPIGRDFINIWAGPRLAFGDRLWAL